MLENEQVPPGSTPALSSALTTVHDQVGPVMSIEPDAQAAFVRDANRLPSGDQAAIDMSVL